MREWVHKDIFGCGGTVRIIVKTNEQRSEEPIHEPPDVARCDKCGKWLKANDLENY